MRKLALIICLALNPVFLFAQQYVWTQKSAFPPGNRYGAFHFSIGNSGYIGSGLTNVLGNILPASDFWEYDAIGDVWSQKASLPDSARYGSTSFAIGNKGYVINGQDYSSNAYTNQNWEYDQATNAWLEKSSFPGSARYTCSSFIINGIAYVGMGYDGSYYSDFYSYDPATDQWDTIADIPGLARQSARGFALNGMGYVMGGAVQWSSDIFDLWQYNPATNSWTSKAPYPGAACYGGAVIEVNGKVLVGTGANQNNSGTTLADFYSYDDATDTWTYATSFAGGTRQGNSYFNIGSMAFVGLGSQGVFPNTLYKDDLWMLEVVDANTISGKLFYDFNNNQILDSGEISLPNKMVTETATGRITFSGLYGDYNLTVLDSGNYSVTTDSLAFFSPVPLSHNVYFSGINQVDSLKDFAFQASSPFRDLSVSLTPYGFFRPGFDAMYGITYTNYGTNVESPVITMVLDQTLTYVTADETPSSIGTDTIVWTLPSINPFQSVSFFVTVNVHSSTTIGDTISSSAEIDPITNDIDVYNNYSSWDQVVTGSYDPNDIQVNLTEITTAQLPSQPWLEYLIRFQNTGTDTAFNIDVTNAVPAGVELSSFELISSSHPVALRYDANFNLLGFKFNNILLADSNTNETLSHGFIRYRIKPSTTLSAGDVIENSASIYFDFNAPVLTNTAFTHIIIPTSVASIAVNNQQLQVFPNPAKDEIIIQCSPQTQPAYISICDILGNEILRQQYSTSYLKIQTSNLSAGVYFIIVKTLEKTYRKKLVIE